MPIGSTGSPRSSSCAARSPQPSRRRWSRSPGRRSSSTSPTTGSIPAAVGRGIGDQIGLACRVSPFHGSRRLGIARALHFDLPGVRDLLAAGRISEEIAATVVSETRHLDAERRRLVDEQICRRRDRTAVAAAGGRVVGRLAYEADRAAYVARGRTAGRTAGSGCGLLRTR